MARQNTPQWPQLSPWLIQFPARRRSRLRLRRKNLSRPIRLPELPRLAFQYLARRSTAGLFSRRRHDNVKKRRVGLAPPTCPP